MAFYILYDSATGNITTVGSCAEDMVELQGEHVVAAPDSNFSALTHYVSEGQIFEYTIAQRQLKSMEPRYPALWSNVTMQWEDQRSLQDQKDAQWQKIKNARALELESPLSTPYGAVDNKGTSKTDITDAVLMLQTLAAMGTPTTIDFTMTDNTTATLTTAQMVTVGLLLGQKVQAAHAKARGLRADIEAATTKEAVEAITWV